MGSERRIHIFKLAAPATKGLKLVEYSVKNTFVDGLITPPFSEDLQEDTERVALSALLFPATPNGEGLRTAFDEMPASENVPVVQWVSPATATVDAPITVLPPAFWDPSPAQILIDSPIAPKEPGQQQNQEQPQDAGPLQGPTAQLSPQASPLLLPGTLVVLSGLANQPKCNGLRGWVSDFDAVHGRYNIIVEIGPNLQRSMVKVKPDNLLIAQSCLPAPLPYCPLAQQQMIQNWPVKASLCLDQMV